VKLARSDREVRRADRARRWTPKRASVHAVRPARGYTRETACGESLWRDGWTLSDGDSADVTCFPCQLALGRLERLGLLAG
jgi:hypothetical protein